MPDGILCRICPDKIKEKQDRMKTKRLFILLSFILCIASVNAQRHRSMHYSVEYNTGMSPSSTHKSIDVSTLWRLNQRYLGLASGLDFLEKDQESGHDNKGEVLAIPLLVKYVRHSPIRRLNRRTYYSLYFSAALGGKAYLDELPTSEYTHRIAPMGMLSMGLYFPIRNRFGLTCGLSAIGHEIGCMAGINAGIRF